VVVEIVRAEAEPPRTEIGLESARGDVAVRDVVATPLILVGLAPVKYARFEIDIGVEVPIVAPPPLPVIVIGDAPRIVKDVHEAVPAQVTVVVPTEERGAFRFP